jgi:sulfate/thiosulfate transport system ATP-binding protein
LHRADLDATHLSVQQRQIGFVFQNYALFNHMTVKDNISFSIRLRRLRVDVDAR